MRERPISRRSRSCLVARSVKEKQFWAPYVKGAIEKGQRIEITGKLTVQTLEVEVLSVVLKVEKLPNRGGS